MVFFENVFHKSNPMAHDEGAGKVVPSVDVVVPSVNVEVPSEETLMPSLKVEDKPVPSVNVEVPSEETLMPSLKVEDTNKCLKCGHVWLRRVLVPVRCPRCQTCKWQTPRKTEIQK